MLNEDKIEKLEELARPLRNFLEENYNPHCRIIIDNEGVRVIGDLLGIPVNKKSTSAATEVEELKKEIDKLKIKLQSLEDDHGILKHHHLHLITGRLEDLFQQVAEVSSEVIQLKELADS